MSKLEVFYHSVGFNIVKLDSILRHGLMSQKKANEDKVSFARSYSGYNLDDTISLVRGIYSSLDEEGAYKKYITSGITIEMFLSLDEVFYDVKDRYFNYYDEVLGKDYIPKEKFSSIVIPKEYEDYSLTDLPILTLSSTSYQNIKDTSDNIISYIENTLNSKVEKEEYNDLLNELKLTIKALSLDTEDKELQESFMDIKYELNCFLTESLTNAFKPLIKRENITILDIVTYINDMTLNLPIIIKDYKRGKKR